MRNLVAPILVALVSAGCMSWRPALSRTGELIPQQSAEVRLSSDRGARYDVHEPQLLGDYVFGYKQYGSRSSRIAVPVRDVRSVQERRFDPVRTTILASAVTVTGIVLAAALDASHASGLKLKIW